MRKGKITVTVVKTIDEEGCDISFNVKNDGIDVDIDEVVGLMEITKSRLIASLNMPVLNSSETSIH